MHSEFEMSMMGELNFFLGLQIKQLKEGTFINQAKYIRDLLKRFNMEEAKTMKTPMSSSIKLDMDEKGKSVNSTMYRGMIGHSLVSWHSKKQNSVALSMAEAEYIAAGLCCAQILWMKQTLSDFNLIFEHVPIKCDNTSAINISKNPVQHSRTKHIEIRHHFLRDHAQKGDITLEFALELFWDVLRLGFHLKPRVSIFGRFLCPRASSLVQLHLHALRASGWFCSLLFGFILSLDFSSSYSVLGWRLRRDSYLQAQGKRLASHLSLSRQRLAERRGMTHPLQFRRRLSRYKQKFAEESRSREKYQFLPTSALRCMRPRRGPLCGFELERLLEVATCRCLGDGQTISTQPNRVQPSPSSHDLLHLIATGGHRDSTTSTPLHPSLLEYSRMRGRLSRETDFEAPTSYDTYDEQSLGRMKFEKALDGSWIRRAERHSRPGTG
ncbi:Copia protein [Vitis vinifera]|uniref:Copia protein n=1 Tax=Vitis vinifera TaxID=29760 RepID=A0A438G282_VITVI|nr:Copia protein [Vitis vinifera]